MRLTLGERLVAELSKPGWLLAGGILAVALLIRLAGLGAESAWIDEGYSIVLARYAIPDIIRGTAADQHPPLYYLLLHFWLGLGESVWNARLLSVLFGVVNVYQALVFGRKLGGQWLGLGAGLLLAVNPMHVWYSQEARQYMLLTVLTTAAMMEFWACLQGKRRWVTYGLFTLLALYTQYFAIFIVLAQAVIMAAWWVWRRNGQEVHGWLASVTGVGLLFAPWLPTAVNQFLYHTMPWIGEPAATAIRDIPLRLILGSGVLVLPGWVRWLGMAGLIAIFIWSLWRLHKNRVEQASEFGFLATWGLLPYLVISLAAIFYPLFQFKQFLLLLPPFLMLATAIAGLFTRRWKHLAYLGLLIIPLFSLVYQQVTLSKDDWRGLSEYVEANFERGDAVYTNPAGAELVLELYLDPAISIDGYPADFDILTGGWKGEMLSAELAEEEMSGIAEVSKRLWLVEFFPEFWDEEGLFADWLDGQAALLEEQHFGEIRLRLYQFEPGEP